MEKKISPEVVIILASYNGAAFIADQLSSVQNQTYSDWLLLLRDDGSEDETVQLFKEIAKLETRFQLLSDNLSRLGAAESFHCLMREVVKSSARYVVFADQDDIWLPHKLSKQMALMKELEAGCPEIPVLVHSDLEVVDAELNPIAPSFMDYQGIRNESTKPLQVLLAQNYVTGCTVIINRALLDMALPMPANVLMHDWWLALCAAVFGRLEFSNEPLVKYRQHGGNVIGAKNLCLLLNPLKNNWQNHWLKGRDNLTGSLVQAKALVDRITERDPDNTHLFLVNEYSSLIDLPPLYRMKKLYALGVHMQAPLRQALLLSRMLCLPRGPEQCSGAVQLDSREE